MLYRSVQVWVDNCWDSRTKWRGLLAPTLGAVLLSMPFKGRESIAESIAFWSLCALAGIWQTYVFWRFWHHLKRDGLKAGRLYEKQGRYKLPPEYADSEDALMADERRKKQKPTPPPR